MFTVRFHKQISKNLPNPGLYSFFFGSNQNLLSLVHEKRKVDKKKKQRHMTHFDLNMDIYIFYFSFIIIVIHFIIVIGSVYKM